MAGWTFKLGGTERMAVWMLKYRGTEKTLKFGYSQTVEQKSMVV